VEGNDKVGEKKTKETKTFAGHAMATASIYKAKRTGHRKACELFIAHKRRQKLWIQQAKPHWLLIWDKGFKHVTLSKS
jgi:hypothetical protein